MYYTILRLYTKTKNEEVVTKAVVKGWITQDEANTILGE